MTTPISQLDHVRVVMARYPGEEGVEVVRTYERAEYGGWDLSLALDRSYIQIGRAHV